MENTANYNAYGIQLDLSCNNHIFDNVLTNNTLADYLDYDPCQSEAPNLNYFPLILIISTIIVGGSVFIIYKNRKKFKKPREDLEFL
jgi:parallel beta-helix repeat protein